MGEVARKWWWKGSGAGGVAGEKGRWKDMGEEWWGKARWGKVVAGYEMKGRSGRGKSSCVKRREGGYGIFKEDLKIIYIFPVCVR